MDFQALLQGMPKSTFVDTFLYRQPFSLPGAADSLRPLGNWTMLDTLLKSDNPDVMVVRDGRRYDGPVPGTGEEARKLHAEGCTILVRHAERHDPSLARLARSFERDFGAEVNVHLYSTPPGHHGFSWHYDAEDVFIIQTAGAKHYSLRKNTVHPWPVVESIPRDMRYDREIMPLMRVTLNAGDWLYIPCGHWHKAESDECETPAISLAVGVMSPSALEVLDFLRAKLVGSLAWRQRLPVLGDADPLGAEELESRHRDLLAHLAGDLDQVLRDPEVVGEFLEYRRRREAPE